MRSGSPPGRTAIHRTRLARRLASADQLLYDPDGAVGVPGDGEADAVEGAEEVGAMRRARPRRAVGEGEGGAVRDVLAGGAAGDAGGPEAVGRVAIARVVRELAGGRDAAD